MLRLYILRHAKAAVASPAMKDFDRPLAARGETDCLQLSRAMAALDYIPRHILCSPARRTQMTLEGIDLAWRGRPRPEIEYRQALYSGDHTDYLAAIRALGETTAGMLIGHNPNCEVVTAMLCGSGADEPMHLLRQKFPTGALAVIDIQAGHWADTRPGTGHLVDFLLPGDQ